MIYILQGHQLNTMMPYPQRDSMTVITDMLFMQTRKGEKENLLWEALDLVYLKAKKDQ